MQWAYTFTSNDEETLKVLMNTHFPQDPPTAPSPTQLTMGESEPDEVVIQSILGKRRIKWAIDSFLPLKTSRPDGIFPEVFTVTKFYQGSY